jgi:Domain of unknown function (DUF1841)
MSLSERNELREQILTAWAHAQAGKTITPLEQQIVEVVEEHAEYHSLFENPSAIREKNFTTENNPFLHISLHISLNEQLRTNRPTGIRELFAQFIKKLGDEHRAAHHMMGIMAEIIWDAQQNGQLPDEKIYLKKLQTQLTLT